MIWLDIFHILTLSLTIGFGFFFLFGPHYNLFQSRLLGLFFLLSNVRFLIFLLLKYHLTDYTPYLFAFSGVASFILPPVLWLYLLTVLEKREKFEKLDWLHFTPGLLMFIWNLPQIFQPIDQLQESLKSFSSLNIARIYYVAGGEVVSDLRFSVSLAVIFLVYNIYYWKKLWPFMNQTGDSVISKESRIWILYLFVGFTVLYLFNIIMSILAHGMVTDFELDLKIKIFFILRALLFWGLFILLFRSRELLFGVVTVDTDEFPIEENIVDLSIEEEGQTWFLINHYLAGHPYIQQQFNLQVMSKAIQVNSSVVSALIRKKHEKSFVEFRNDLRVGYAKLLIEQHLHKTQTLESIGRMSGFASRTTFFNAFKKSTGKNPSQFAEEIR